MNRAIIPSLIKEEQLHAYPNDDMGPWNENLPNHLPISRDGTFWMREFTKVLPI